MMDRESIKSICVGRDVFFRSNILPQVYAHSYFKGDDPYVELIDEKSAHLTEYAVIKKSRNIFDYILNILRVILPIVFIIIGFKDKSFQFLTIGVFMILPQFSVGWELLHKVINILFRRKLLISEYRLKDTLSSFEMMFDKSLRIPTYEDVKAAPPSDSYTRDIDGMFYILTFTLVTLDIIFVYPNMKLFWILAIAIFPFCMAISNIGLFEKIQKLIYQAPTEESYYQILACMKAWTQMEQNFEKMQREQGYIAIVFEEPVDDEEANGEEQNQDQDANKPEE